MTESGSQDSNSTGSIGSCRNWIHVFFHRIRIQNYFLFSLSLFPLYSLLWCSFLSLYWHRLSFFLGVYRKILLNLFLPYFSSLIVILSILIDKMLLFLISQFSSLIFPFRLFSCLNSMNEYCLSYPVKIMLYNNK